MALQTIFVALTDVDTSFCYFDFKFLDMNK